MVDLAKRSKTPCYILNVDFEKAYDSVSCNFLNYMCLDFGLMRNEDLDEIMCLCWESCGAEK